MKPILYDEIKKQYPLEWPLLDIKPVPTHIHTSVSRTNLMLYVFDGEIAPQRGLVVFPPPRVFEQNWDTGGSYFEPERVWV